MQRVPVFSTELASVGYEAGVATLEVEFTGGGRYQYLGVPQEIYDALLNAESKGRYFNANIRDRYPFVRL